jgi:putative hydroxymethylpyrimidine transport system substrate-binding protein
VPAARPALLMAVLAALVLAGCGGAEDETSRGPGRAALAERTDATLVLDFVPNAVHTGIYCALDNGY